MIEILWRSQFVRQKISLVRKSACCQRTEQIRHNHGFLVSYSSSLPVKKHVIECYWTSLHELCSPWIFCWRDVCLILENTDTDGTSNAKPTWPILSLSENRGYPQIAIKWSGNNEVLYHLYLIPSTGIGGSLFSGPDPFGHLIFRWRLAGLEGPRPSNGIPWRYASVRVNC